MVTIKQLAESLGVSKVAISKWLERNQKKECLEKVGNKYYVPSDIEASVRSYFADREPKRAEKDNSTIVSDNTLTEEIIALLREQLEAKDKEISRLQEQVDNLIKALREANTLHHQAMQQLTEPEENEEPIKEGEDAEVVLDQKRSFWSRFKSRLG